MANHLDLEEQEQLDQLKHFWKRYGNLISWVLIAVLGAYASWNFYQYWQRNQAMQAAAMYDELSRTVQSADAAKIDRVFADMKDRFASTTYAQQAGLLVAKKYYELGKVDSAKSVLGWVADNSSDSGYQSVARLRLAGVLAETKGFDEALKLLDGTFPASFAALVEDRKGDIYLMQGNKPQAVLEYEKAFKGFSDRVEYQSVVEIKLNSLGVDPKKGANISNENVEAKDGAAVLEGKK